MVIGYVDVVAAVTNESKGKKCVREVEPVRFARREVERAEKVMEGLRAEEDGRLMLRKDARQAKHIQQMKPAIYIGENVDAFPDWSPVSSDASLPASSSSSTSSLSTVVSDHSEYEQIFEDGPSKLSIVIDVFMDLNHMPILPSSPTQYEMEVARLEKLDRSSSILMGKGR